MSAFLSTLTAYSSLVCLCRHRYTTLNAPFEIGFTVSKSEIPSSRCFFPSSCSFWLHGVLVAASPYPAVSTGHGLAAYSRAIAASTPRPALVSPSSTKKRAGQQTLPHRNQNCRAHLTGNSYLDRTLPITVDMGGSAQSMRGSGPALLAALLASSGLPPTPADSLRWGGAMRFSSPSPTATRSSSSAFRAASSRSSFCPSAKGSSGIGR
eukprot:2753381-Rhodomonas_salina.1